MEIVNKMITTVIIGYTLFPLCGCHRVYHKVNEGPFGIGRYGAGVAVLHPDTNQEPTLDNHTLPIQQIKEILNRILAHYPKKGQKFGWKKLVIREKYLFDDSWIAQIVIKAFTKDPLRNKKFLNMNDIGLFLQKFKISDLNTWPRIVEKDFSNGF